MKEADIQKQIVDWLRLNGWKVAVTSQKGFAWSTPGLSDLIVVKWMPDAAGTYYARHIWIECKGPKGAQSPAQINFQEELERQRAEYLVANSLDVVIDYLKGTR